MTVVTIDDRNPVPMIPEAAVVLHAGPGHEVTFAGYLYRVVVHLVAVGAVAVVLYWSLGRG